MQSIELNGSGPSSKSPYGVEWFALSNMAAGGETILCVELKMRFDFIYSSCFIRQEKELLIGQHSTFHI